MTNEEIAVQAKKLLLGLRGSGLKSIDVLTILLSALAATAVYCGVSKDDVMENVERAYDAVSGLKQN